VETLRYSLHTAKKESHVSGNFETFLAYSKKESHVSGNFEIFLAYRREKKVT
jgi:hypothetical protein